MLNVFKSVVSRYQVFVVQKKFRGLVVLDCFFLFALEKKIIFELSNDTSIKIFNPLLDNN